MYVSEVATLFLQYVDERDPTFFDDPMKQTWLKMGYDMFRQLVKVDDEKVYLRDVSLVFASTSEYDLAAAASAVRILGNNAALTGPRMRRIYQLKYRPTTTSPAWRTYVLRACHSADDMATNPETSYFFSGSVITLAYVFNGTLTLTYEPASSVDWTKTASTDTEFIDDLEDFHDLIALLAAQHYAVADRGWNNQLQALLDGRKAALCEFLRLGRDPANNTMNMNYDP